MQYLGYIFFKLCFYPIFFRTLGNISAQIFDGDRTNAFNGVGKQNTAQRMQKNVINIDKSQPGKCGFALHAKTFRTKL